MDDTNTLAPEMPTISSIPGPAPALTPAGQSLRPEAPAGSPPPDGVSGRSLGGAPTPPAGGPKPRSPVFTIALAVIMTAVVVSGIFYGLSLYRPQQVAVTPTPTPTPMATPTPIRQPSTIAGQPAFLQFQSAVATLSAAIAGFSAQDPTLTPPTLVLPLGFSK